MSILPPQSAAVPPGIRCAADYARLARDVIDPALFAHIDGGSGRDMTAQANLAAFADRAIVPRLLRDVSGGETACTMADMTLPHPILLAPVAAQGSVHPDAERATALAARATHTVMIASSLSSLTLEDIAATGEGHRWFQLYLQPDRATNVGLLRRAADAGYRAIMVTLDTPVQVPSFAAERAGYVPPTAVAANLAGYPLSPPVAVAAGDSRILRGMMARAPGWGDLDWLLGATTLPVWVKGVLHPEDARALVARGVAGVVVSNHGGRSLDGAPPSLTVLPGIRAAIGAGVPILFDGGIRSGRDVFMAIASGADAVLVGRLQMFALAVAGALGVAHMIRTLREELELCMALAGCATLEDVRMATLVNRSC
ncbi:MAG: alpha-hydroxy acid oxidase [Pseudomonadota bacterium]